ncbi:hypothetical protein MWG58_32275 [Streptomyces sp. WAC00276]|nr:hypothetical protein [Streptomyces sp. WAC00276]MCK2145489.1 hypothetical protein [Streptomyces sp. WAC00276]
MAALPGGEQRLAGAGGRHPGRGVAAFAEVLPEVGEAGGARVAPGHADDGDGIGGAGVLG